MNTWLKKILGFRNLTDKTEEILNVKIENAIKIGDDIANEPQIALNNKADQNLSFELIDDENIEIQKSENAPITGFPLIDYKYPTVDLLDLGDEEKCMSNLNEFAEITKNQIINTFNLFDIDIKKVTISIGPTFTLYEIIPPAGVRISMIKKLETDLALSLAVSSVRIIPITEKGTIGIEVPNSERKNLGIRTLLSSDKFIHNSYSLPIALGKKIDSGNFIFDLTEMPHLLISGATGQGKSIALNVILISLLYSKHPSQLKIVLIDTKKVEFSPYKNIENHFLAKLSGEKDAIIVDAEKSTRTLNSLCSEMDNRYDLLKEAGCRNIKEYNQKFSETKLDPEKGHQFLPFIVLIIDEFADLIMTSGKDVEKPIARLAQLSKAVGIHLVIATERPTQNIISGSIKASFSTRIAFKMSSKIDSITIGCHRG